MVRFSGVDDLGRILAQTWELDLRQRTWVRRNPAHSPPARQGATLTYDEARGVAVLFGGLDADFEYLNDTWLWDGQDWTESFPPQQPQARWAHAQAYDSLRERVVVFGGIGLFPPGFFDDLWEWDGQDWRERPATTRPSARYSAALTYDSQRDALILFSGVIGCCIPNDTWEYFNDQWTRRQPAASPPGRGFPAYAYSPIGGYTMIFGGQGEDFSFRDDTWLWDGVNWTEVAADRHPAARSSTRAVYVARPRGILLHGGLAADQSSELKDTWVYLDP